MDLTATHLGGGGGGEVHRKRNQPYFVKTSPWCDKRFIQVEPEAKWIWRDDQWREPFSRHYSPESFVERIASRMPKFEKRILFFTNIQELSTHYTGQRIYCYFMFKGEKL